MWGGAPVAAQDDAPFPYQIGLEAAEFLKLLEEQDEPGAYALVGRWVRGEHHALRIGLSYRHNTREDGTLEVGARLGADRFFVRDGRWRFYVGADVVGLYEGFGGGDRRTVRAGVSPLLGFMFFISPRFSVSTEPRLVALYNRFTETDSFREEDTEAWYTFELGGIGQLQVSFHF